MDDSKVKLCAQYATILGAVVTAGSMVFGVLTYHRSAVEQRQAAALGILQEYIRLSVKHPDLASRARNQPVDAKYNWFATHALFTAETIWTLVRYDQKWVRAIDAIFRQHRSYLEQGVLTCEDYQPEFVKWMQNRIPELKCARYEKEVN